MKHLPPFTFSCQYCHLSMTVSAQLAGVTGPCPQCGQTITAPFPPTLSSIPAADLTATPQPTISNADELAGLRAPLPAPPPPQPLHAPMTQAAPGPMNLQVSMSEGTPRILPPNAVTSPNEAKHFVAKQTNNGVKWGIRAVLLLLLVSLSGYYYLMQQSRKAAEEALIMRQEQQQQQNRGIEVQNDWKKKFNEEMKRQDEEFMEDLRRQKARKQEQAKRESEARGEKGGPVPRPPKINFIDMEEGVTEEVLVLLGDTMPFYKNGTPKSKLIAQTARASWMKSPVSEWPQILLTNEVTFNGHTKMEGASSFVIEAVNGSHWLITAEQIIGESGGVDPPLVAEELDGALQEWKAYPPRTPEKFITAKGAAPGMNNAACYGTLAVRLSSASITSLPVKALKISKRRAALGDVLYLIGLPFYDDLHPQNVYTCTVNDVTPKQGSFRVAIDAEALLRRGRGAPLINSDGEVVGILTFDYGQVSNEVAEAIILEKFISN